MQITYVPNKSEPDGLPVQQVDPMSRAAATIDLEQYFMHQGQNYRIDQVISIGSGGTANFVVVAPSLPTMIHFCHHVVVQAETAFNIWEDTVCSNNGTNVPGYNANRLLGGASKTLISGNPTVTSNGNNLAQWHAGSGKATGGDWPGQEQLILKQKGTYMLSAINISNQTEWVAFHFSFYEMIAPS